MPILRLAPSQSGGGTTNHIGGLRMANGFVGRASEGGIGRSCSEVNTVCHGYTGGVSLPNGNVAKNVVMTSPKVYAIYWDEYFRANPQAVYTMNQFFSQILTGLYMRQLEQYGVGQGRFLGSSTIVPDPVTPPPASLGADQIVTQLRQWITSGTVTVQPQRNLLYVIFTPNSTNMGPCVAGLHGGATYPLGATGQDNLFWAAIQQWHEYGPPPVSGFADSCTWAVSHEMVEALTNPDGTSGWAYRSKGNVCEIADICECAQGSRTNKTPIITTAVDGWVVETYWDNVNKSCYPLNIVPQKLAPKVGYEMGRRKNEKSQKRQL
jgi:hypothetical protein